MKSIEFSLLAAYINCAKKAAERIHIPRDEGQCIHTSIDDITEEGVSIWVGKGRHLMFFPFDLLATFHTKPSALTEYVREQRRIAEEMELQYMQAMQEAEQAMQEIRAERA